MRSKRELQAKLTPEQQKAALLLVQNKLSHEAEEKDKNLDEIAAECGVHRQTLWRWRQNRIFIDYMNCIADEFLASYHTDMLQIVVETGKKHGSLKAVELYAKLRGLLKDHQVVETADSKSRSDAEVEKEIEELEKLLNDDYDRDMNL